MTKHELNKEKYTRFKICIESNPMEYRMRIGRTGSLLLEEYINKRWTIVDIITKKFWYIKPD